MFRLRLFALFSVLPAVVSAQSPDAVKETIIVTGVAQPVIFEALSRAVTVITREQIAALPARTVADVLRLAASVEVRARGGRGVQSDFSVRGAGFGQALVLVDGVRLNDAQSGHHNGDIPVPLEAIERIEVLLGGGSSLYGADAFGGTINVITRKTGTARELTVGGGEHGLAEASGAATFSAGPVRQLVSGMANRSSGFMFARDFRTFGLTSQTMVGRNTRVLATTLWKDFGANGFYGSSPSHERTDQTLVTLDRAIADVRSWKVQGTASYRTHGDDFLWDVRRPGVLENVHRTHALTGTVRAGRAWAGGTRVTIGGETGTDWIRSSNLGDHALARGSGFAEVERRLGSRAGVTAGVRVDGYTTFGSAWSPSVSGYAWVGPAVKLRAAGGRAFRVPTFTELYYRDPNHQARSGLASERAWTGDAGADWLLGSGWLVTSTLFARQESNVIDWLRATPAEKWQTHNIRQVRTRGVEIGARRSFGIEAFGQLQYTWMDQRATAVSLLSKYVLDYAPRRFAAAGLVPLGGGVRLAPRVEYTRRASGRDYWALEARVSRRVGPADLFVDGSNLLDATYEEIAGVLMPPRWISVGVRFAAF